MNYSKHLSIVAGVGSSEEVVHQKVANLHQEWEHCTKCQIGIYAAKKVHLRGTVPCELLFIGEAPGVSENMVGAPFVGSSGDILNTWIERAAAEIKMPVYAIANTVACRPCDKSAGGNRVPTQSEQDNCWPRFAELMSIANPRLVVLLGRVANDYWLSQDVRKLYPLVMYTHEMYHPMYIGRKGGVDTKLSKQMVDSLVSFIRQYT